MANDSSDPVSTPESSFQSRAVALQSRVNAAALALHEQGVRPTVARVRAALGGGSPNDLAPAVRHWKEEVLPTLQTRPDDKSGPPPQVADLMRELWTRAVAAAAIDKRVGGAALQFVARSEEAGALRDQITSLRNQLEREAMSYGELRAQAARHEAIAKDALGRVREIEERERKALYQLGEAKQRIAELQARAESTSPRPRQPTRPAIRRPVKVASRAARMKPKVRKPKRPVRRPATTGRRSKPRTRRGVKSTSHDR